MDMLYCITLKFSWLAQHFSCLKFKLKTMTGSGGDHQCQTSQAGIKLENKWMMALWGLLFMSDPRVLRLWLDWTTFVSTQWSPRLVWIGQLDPLSPIGIDGRVGKREGCWWQEEDMSLDKAVRLVYKQIMNHKDLERLWHEEAIWMIKNKTIENKSCSVWCSFFSIDHMTTPAEFHQWPDKSSLLSGFLDNATRPVPRDISDAERTFKFKKDSKLGYLC